MSKFTVVPDPTESAYPQQPPHSGCHFRPTHPSQIDTHKGPRKQPGKRFFEGWYYRITLDENISFAFIYSIEDPFSGSNLSLACHQIMGPCDEYLVQADTDHTRLWAWQHQQGVGCSFDPVINETAAIDPDEFMVDVQSGFQFTPRRLQGKLVGHDGSNGGVLQGEGQAGECEYDLSIEPLAGWGDTEQGQKSTAGWLASYAVFEPHWQVTMADGRASGHVVWKGERYKIKNAPFYAEKNWGGSFPIKWFWCQCNSFDNNFKNLPLSVTAGGGTRKLPLLRSKESLGMVSIHYNGTFYEATPWLGTMDWEISDWGYWKMTGKCTGGKHKFYTEFEAVAPNEAPGVKLRAPTEKDGMVYFCRDSFLAHVTLRLWDLTWDKELGDWIRGELIVDAMSQQGAVEIGGGPWWDTWKDKSAMKQPMKGLVRLPYRLGNLRKRLPRLMKWKSGKKVQET